jgi:hypothetical protein
MKETAPKDMYITKEMYGTDPSAIFSTQVNNTLYSTQYDVYVQVD